jgi:arylsulfatase A
MNAAKHFLTTCLIATCGLNVMAQKNTKPNIIVVPCDDMGYGDLGCNGPKLNRTSNLDRMVSEGVRFTDCYAAANVCSPSRIALLTGRYPIRIGIVNGLHPWQSIGLDSTEVTIAETLKKAGYYTGMVGKWYLSHQLNHLPLQQGFQEYFGIPYSNDIKPCIYMRGNNI